MNPARYFCFFLVLPFSLYSGVFVASAEEIESVSVTEGDPVTLNTGFTGDNDSLIMWRFKNYKSESRIAQLFQQNFSVFDEAETERFRERLNVDLQTGSLTINHINKSHAGLYKVQKMNGGIKYKIFRVSVYAVLPDPVIIRDSSPCSSSRCLLWCSAVNVSDATLSWFIGSSEISSIHLNAENLNWSLPLAVEHEDGNIYSCVVNNSISSRKTLSRSSDLCQCSGVTTTPESRSRHFLLIPLAIPMVAILLVCLYLCLVLIAINKWKQFCQNQEKKDLVPDMTII